MKTETITVNKTEENPDGLKLDVVIPTTPMEENLLIFFLKSHLKQAKAADQVPYELPENFMLKYQKEGTFLVSNFPSEDMSGTQYYQNPTPIALVGIRTDGARFELIQAELKPQQLQNMRHEQLKEKTEANKETNEESTEETADTKSE